MTQFGMGEEVARAATTGGKACVSCVPSESAPIRFIVKLFSLANYTLLFVWIERQDYSIHMSSVLQVQQLYTAGIPLLEAYYQWPFSNNQTRKERLSPNKVATSNVVLIRTHAHFPRRKNGDLSCSRTTRQQSIFKENHLKFSTFIR